MWFILSLLSSFFDSLKYVTGKKVTKEIDPIVIGFSQWFFGTLIFLPFFLNNLSVKTDTGFWPVLIINAFLNALAIILFWRGVKLSDLSLAIPLITFIPIFVLIISSFLTHEIPSFFGIIGVMIIVMGAYLLNLDKKIRNVWQPFYAIIHKPGSKFILIVTILWSFSTVLDKIAILKSNPVIYLFYLNLATMLILLPLVLFKFVGKIKPKYFLIMLVMGVIAGMGLLTQFNAVKYTFVSYVSAIKTSSVIFTIILGHFIFKEKNIKERLSGSVVMILGALLIIFYG